MMETRKTTGLTLLLAGVILRLIDICFLVFWFSLLYFDVVPSHWLIILIFVVFLISLMANIIIVVGVILARKEYKVSVVPKISQVATAARFCTKCGRQITITDAVFCPSCGNKLEG